MVTMEFSNTEQVVQEFGQPLLAQRNTLVQVRPAVGTEIFSKSYGDLTAVEGQDWVLMPEGGEGPYPCKIDIFADTWEPVGDGKYRRKALSRLIQVPEGVEVILHTLEGDVKVYNPDFIALGAHGEVYSNSKDWADANLRFITP